MGPYIPLGAVFLLAMGLAFFLVPVAGALGKRLGAVDRPRRGEVQARQVPRTGGYAILIAFVAAVALSLLLLPRNPDESPRLWGLLLGAALVIPLALLDDFRRLGPLPQFAGQVIIAGVPMAFDVLVSNVSNPFGGLLYLPAYLVLPVTFLWFLGMMNTLNFIDTMDGLAGGVSAIAALVLLVRAVQLEQYTIAALMLALVGACLGFLPHNLHPARIFMGTSGSLLLGYSLAVLAIIGGAKIATTAMVLAVPIVDTALVIGTRALQGRSPFKGGDAAHLPHRLLEIGFSQRAIVFVLYALCLGLGVLALGLSAWQKLYTLIAVGVVLALLVGLVALRVESLRASPSRAYQGNDVRGPVVPR